MSRFGSTNYSPQNSDDNNSSENYEERTTVLMSSYCIVTFEIDSVSLYSGDYGQSLILNMNEFVVREGVVADREDSDKVKLFDWGRWYDRDEDMELVPFDDDTGITLDDIGNMVTTEAGGSTYRYFPRGGYLESENENEEIGSAEVWLSNSKKVRTLAKLLSQEGHNIIDEDNKREEFDWLNAGNEQEFALRPELEGREVMMWFESVTLTPDDYDDIDEEVTFTDTVLLDAVTEAGITIPNNTESGETVMTETASEPQEATTDGGTTAVEKSESYDFENEEVDSLIDTFADSGMGEGSRESIKRVLEDSVEDGESIDMDKVMSAVQHRA